jgi:maleylpyruvate isomerase
VDFERVVDAQARFDVTIAGLTDDAARRPSALPDWTVGHLLTHVARNADSHTRRSEAAARGEIVDQYPGGFEGRAADIEAGAGRTAAELIDDVLQSAERLATTWRGLPDAAWSMTTRDVGGRARPLHALVDRRWQELEVHVIDLGFGPTHREWSDAFVRAFLPRLRDTLADRLPAGTDAPTALDERDELAWLYGRLEHPDLPLLSPWS